MKEERYHIALDDYEHGVVIRALNDTKTELMNEGKSFRAYSATKSFLLLQSSKPMEGLSASFFQMPSTADR